MFKLIEAQREAAKQRKIEEDFEEKREDENQEFDFEKIYEENELENRENMNEGEIEEARENKEIVEEIKKTVSSSTHKEGSSIEIVQSDWLSCHRIRNNLKTDSRLLKFRGQNL